MSCVHVHSEQWWPSLTAIWPAFAEAYAATGERTVFSLQPTENADPG